MFQKWPLTLILTFLQSQSFRIRKQNGLMLEQLQNLKTDQAWLSYFICNKSQKIKSTNLFVRNVIKKISLNSISFKIWSKTINYRYRAFKLNLKYCSNIGRPQLCPTILDINMSMTIRFQIPSSSKSCQFWNGSCEVTRITSNDYISFHSFQLRPGHQQPNNLKEDTPYFLSHSTLNETVKVKLSEIRGIWPSNAFSRIQTRQPKLVVRKVTFNRGWDVDFSFCK